MAATEVSGDAALKLLKEPEVRRRWDAGWLVPIWGFLKMGDPQNVPSHHRFQYLNGLYNLGWFEGRNQPIFVIVHPYLGWSSIDAFILGDETSQLFQWKKLVGPKRKGKPQNIRSGSPKVPKESLGRDTWIWQWRSFLSTWLERWNVSWKGLWLWFNDGGAIANDPATDMRASSGLRWIKGCQKQQSWHHGLSTGLESRKFCLLSVATSNCQKKSQNSGWKSDGRWNLPVLAGARLRCSPTCRSSKSSMQDWKDEGRSIRKEAADQSHGEHGEQQVAHRF